MIKKACIFSLFPDIRQPVTMAQEKERIDKKGDWMRRRRERRSKTQRIETIVMPCQIDFAFPVR
jgi:hypothetical protein